jgi:acetyltransferase-like isoleucine patch superfamily enzyme
MTRLNRLARGARNRLFQVIALYAPGASTFRVWLHRHRGVEIGDDAFIGTAALIETEVPERVSIGNGVTIGIRTVIIAHFRAGTKVDATDSTARHSVRIGDDVFIGPGVIILPNVRIGDGAVVNAGSVVTRSVAPLTMVQGNPAKPIARCGIPLGRRGPLREFYRQLVPIP